MPKLKHKNSSMITSLLNKKYMVLLANFVFQGMRYMTRGELIFKLSFTLIFCCLFSVFINNIFLAAILGHFANFSLNGQFFVLSRYLFSRDAITTNELSNFIQLIGTSYRKFGIDDVLVIGSFCRVEMTSSSDLDLRIMHKADFRSSCKAYFYAFFLRFLGVIRRFPMDVYCFSDLTFLEKLRADETPSFFEGDEHFLMKYPNSRPAVTLVKENIEGWRC